MTPLQQALQWAKQRKKVRGNRMIDTVHRLNLWRIAEAMNYRMTPDEIESNWSTWTVREFSEYQRIRQQEQQSED